MSIKDWIYRVIGNENDVTYVVDDEAEEPVAYSSGGVFIVKSTGQATAPEGSTANTGFSGSLPRGRKVVVENTGNATATGGGYANSGIVYSDKKRRQK